MRQYSYCMAERVIVGQQVYQWFIPSEYHVTACYHSNQTGPAWVYRVQNRRVPYLLLCGVQSVISFGGHKGRTVPSMVPTLATRGTAFATRHSRLNLALHKRSRHI
jgi:hypothetical protein